jgi:hypothetical protein
MTLWSVDVIHRTKVLPLFSAERETGGVERDSTAAMVVLMA